MHNDEHCTGRRRIAFVLFLLLLALGILAFIMTLDVQRETMPPIPTVAPADLEELRTIRDQVRELVVDDETELAYQGEVVDDSSGEPIVAFEVGLAPVEMDRPNWLAFVEWTEVEDDNGEFTIPAPESPVMQLGVRAEGYQWAWLPVDEQQDAYRFRLRQGTVVYGTVKNQSGMPVEGARLFPGPSPDQSQSIGESDEAGAYSITLPYSLDASMPSGTTPITVVHPEYVTTSLNVEAQPGRQRVDIVLSPGGTMTGYVVQDGTPVEGADIVANLRTPAPGPGGPEMVHPENFGPYPAPVTTTTDADGAFELRALFPGEYAVWAKTGDGACLSTLEQHVIIEEGMTTEVAFSASTEFAQLVLNLTVKGEAPSFVNAQLLSMSGGAEVRVDLRAEEPGVYSPTCVPAGPAILHVAAALDGDVMYRTVRDFDFEPDTIVTETVDLGFEGSIEGHVRLGSAGYVMVVALFGRLDTSQVAAYGLEDLLMRAAAQASVSREGNYRLSPLEEGAYTVVAAVAETPFAANNPPPDLRITAQHATVDTTDPVEVDFDL